MADDGEPRLDHLSLASTPLVAFRGGEPLWQGSGFFYMHEDSEGSRFLYLVTSLHLLTGQPPGGRETSIVEHIVFQFHEKDCVPTHVRPVRVPLYTRNGTPAWIESAGSPMADVAVIPVPPSVCHDLTVYCIDASWIHAGNLSPGPGARMQAVAFPYGCHDRANGLPLWQSAILASDFAADFEGEPRMAVEMAAYPGSAGAPVFWESRLQPPSGALDSASAVTFRRFVGVFMPPRLSGDGRFPEAFCTSGQPATIARDAGPLGWIWRADVVEKMVESVDLERWGKEVLANLAS